MRLIPALAVVIALTAPIAEGAMNADHHTTQHSIGTPKPKPATGR